MKQIFLFVLAISLFSYLFADKIITCAPLEGLCCAVYNVADSCKCVKSRVNGCQLYNAPCADKSKRRVYIQKENGIETKCIA